MTTTHTPGPWTVITENKGLSLGITNDQSVPIASRIVDQSNARLIAAAPELLQALQLLLANPGCQFAEGEALAAIVKATA